MHSAVLGYNLAALGAHRAALGVHPDPLGEQFNALGGDLAAPGADARGGDLNLLHYNGVSWPLWSKKHVFLLGLVSGVASGVSIRYTIMAFRGLCEPQGRKVGAHARNPGVLGKTIALPLGFWGGSGHLPR